MLSVGQNACEHRLSSLQSKSLLMARSHIFKPANSNCKITLLHWDHWICLHVDKIYSFFFSALTQLLWTLTHIFTPLTNSMLSWQCCPFEEMNVKWEKLMNCVVPSTLYNSDQSMCFFFIFSPERVVKQLIWVNFLEESAMLKVDKHHFFHKE